MFILLSSSAFSFPAMSFADETIDAGQVVTVPGSNSSPRDVNGYLTIGNTGTGTLNINAGGNGNDSVVILSEAAGSSGNVAVSGAEAKLNISNQFILGRNGSGILTISNDGVVSADMASLVVGGSSSGSGAINLMGSAGSRGVLEVASIVRSGTSLSLILNGGILRALGVPANFHSGVTTTVDTGGDYIDTNGRAITISSSLAGSGQLVKQGIGTLVLAMTAAYSGGTLIEGGTLQLGGCTIASVCSVVGDIENKGRLVYYNFTNQNVTGAISGSGIVEQKAASVLALLGENTYEGGNTITAVTVQIGNGGISGSIKGNVANSGKLTCNRSDNITFAGVISGGDSVEKLADGTLILTENNTYTGATIISAGALQIGAGGTSGSITGSITNNGKMLSNRSNTYVFDGVVTGSGSVQQNGSGIFIIANNSTYAGGTAITTGTLQLGNGGTSGSVTGNIIKNSKLAFNRSDEFTVANLISGNDAAEQKGIGTTIISGSDTYSGGTTISGGTLKVTNVKAVGTGAVKNNAKSELAVNGTFTNVINGSGALVKSGADNTTLTGANSQTGAVTVSEGIFTFGQTEAFKANSLTTKNGATTAISNGASLNVAGSMTQETGATLTLGVSSKLNVDGAFKQSEGSMLKAGLSVSGDALIVANTAELEGALNVSSIMTTGVTKASDLANTFAKLLQTTNEITGDFSSIVSNTGSDYLVAGGRKSSDNKSYDVGLSLAWFAGQQQGHGTFTVANTTDSFNVDVALTDQSGTFASVRDGKSLTKKGSGTLILTGNNSYTATTTINSGLLQIGDGGTTGTLGTNNVVNNSVLAFNRSDNLKLDNVISGSGNFRKMGSGTLILDGVNTYTGLTSFEAGSLMGGDRVHNTATISGDVRVASGATFGGHGTVFGDVQLQSGSTIASGHSIGILTIGSITFGSGSTYLFEASPDGSADRIVVTNANGGTGKATIDAKVTLVLNGSGAGTWASDTNYILVDTTNGVTGTFDSVTNNLAFLDAVVTYNANQVLLGLIRNSTGFDEIGGTHNQKETGKGIGSLPDDHAVPRAVIGMGREDALKAYDNLSGELYGSTRSALLMNSRYLRDAVNRRMLSETWMPSIEQVWFASWEHGRNIDGDGNSAQIANKGWGIALGADGELSENVFAGFVLGYERTEVDSARSSNAGVDTFHLGGYAASEINTIKLRGGMAYSYLDSKMERNIWVRGFEDKAKDDPNGWQLQIFSEASRDFKLSDTAILSPYANIAHVWLNLGDVSEHGTFAALDVDGDTDSTTFTTLGHLGKVKLPTATTVSLYGDFGWQYAFGDIDGKTSDRFTGVGNSFPIKGIGVDEDVALIGAGFNVNINSRNTVTIGYQGQIGNAAQDHAANLI